MTTTTLQRREIASITQTQAVGIAGLIYVAGAASPYIWSKAKELLKPGGAFSGINSSTAGARSQKELPVGTHPLQLYSLATPNGQKITIALEEMGLKYDAWFINIGSEDQFTSGFVAVNPNSKIPAMVDRDSHGQTVNLWESGSILLHLAEKTGRLIPKDPARRTECLNWLFFQIGASPYIGQFGHFHKYAPVKIPYALNRYKMETQRLLDVLDKHLKGKKFICGDELTIADLAWMPWVRCIETGYSADAIIGMHNYTEVNRWAQALLARPAIAKGMRINGFKESEELKNYHSPN